MITSRVHNECGFSVLGILISIIVLAAMGSGMAVLVSSNQSTRTMQLYSDQSFATAQAGLEFALGKIYGGVNPCSSLNINFLGDNFLGDSITINRANDLVSVIGVKGTSTTTLNVTDPIPPSSGQLLQVNTQNAQDAGNGAPPKKLQGVTFQLLPGCGGPVTITTLVVSWSPNYGEGIRQIKFDGGNVYNDISVISGATIDIVDTTISDANIHTIDFIRWQEDIQDRLYTIVFNMSDGSSKTVTIDLQ